MTININVCQKVVLQVLLFCKNMYVKPSGYVRSFVPLGYDAANWVESYV